MARHIRALLDRVAAPATRLQVARVFLPARRPWPPALPHPPARGCGRWAGPFDLSLIVTQLLLHGSRWREYFIQLGDRGLQRFQTCTGACQNDQLTIEIGAADDIELA